MNRIHLLMLLFAVTGNPVTAQEPGCNIRVLEKLDSLKKSGSVSKHFADLYYMASLLLETYASSSSQQVQQFMHRMEDSFSEYFFEAAEAIKNQQEIQDSWKEYYADTGFSPLQLKLMGANAHINGDIWRALCSEFTYEELKSNKSIYKSFNRIFKDPYNRLYSEAMTQNRRVFNLNELSLGFDRLYGWLMLKRWRNRQMRLAILYYENPQRFERKEKIIRKKKQRIDRFIIRMLD